MRIATGEIEDTKRDPVTEANRKGGLKGGKARAVRLTPEQRKRLLRRRLRLAGKLELRLLRRRKHVKRLRVYQSVLNATHDDIWLHHGFAESEFVGALASFPNENSSAFLADKLL